MKLFCPSCGAAVLFRYDDSFVRVCDACRSAIVRTDRGIDTFGKLADLAPASSGLTLHDTGNWRGQSFELAGRASYRHPAGGTWEEWYLKLGDERWAWLASAAGQWVITFRSESRHPLPRFEELSPGMTLTLGADTSLALTVGECNRATLIGAEGELPFLFTPGVESRFADLSDAKGRFATLDYGPEPNVAGAASEAASVYLGWRVSLAELGLKEAELPEPSAPARAGERLACPNCGGSLELRVPGASECVACPYCGSLLDCTGPLEILARLGEVDARPPLIPLGSTGTFHGTGFTVIGRLRRQATYTDGFIQWDEYLLYERAAGYRWLVYANGHYSFVTPLAPGAVQEGPNVATFEGTEFALYDRAEAEVTGVWGELYWKVEVGEKVRTRDYVAPPAMLSREESPAEVHWSLGLYQTTADVRRAFGLPKLPNERRGVGANEPFPHRHWGAVAFLLACALLVSTLVRAFSADARQVYAGSFQLGAASVAEQGAGSGPSLYPTEVIFTPTFELEKRENVDVQLSLPLRDSWAFATVDLIHEASGEFRTFESELSYYSGVEAGEAWSEGSTRADHVLSAGREGSHLLRIELQTPTFSRATLSVRVSQDVFVWSHLAWALLLLGVPAAVLGIWHWFFEHSRWSESDFAPELYTVGGDG